MSEPAAGPDHYLLGHSERELRRLDLQDELYREVTERALRDGGVAAGMRVLDLGCGTGAVSRTAAELVGPAGSVVGIDRSEDGIEAARARAAAAGIENVEYVVGDFTEDRTQGTFDAVVGRFVLMHQRDPAAALATACRGLRSGGVVVMVESHIDLLLHGTHSLPHSPLYEEIVAWQTAVVRDAGADIEAGARLRQTFVAAGLPAPTARLEARLEGGAESPYYHYLAESTHSMLPEARRVNLGGYTEKDVGALEERLREELVASGGVLLVWPVVAAWATKP